VLGAPVPGPLRERAGDFQARVFAMGSVGLEEHEGELCDGTRLDDCRLDDDEPWAYLPPWGEQGALLELGPGDDLPRPLGGRAVRGHGTRAPGLDAGPLLVSPAVAFVLGDDLRLPSRDEVRRALLGACLGLAWRSPSAARRGFERLPGTHLGPWLVTPAPTADVDLALVCRSPSADAPAETRHRVALGSLLERAVDALTALGQHEDLAAGDALLALLPGSVEATPGEPVTVGADGLGELWGQVG
jgi:hypothetical protein